MNEKPSAPPVTAPRRPEIASEPQSKIVRSEQLFGTSREICIEHSGEFYRLRITRRNKLILQK